MLTAEELAELDDLLRESSRREAAADALRIVQRHRGWISNESLHDVAAFLGVAESSLETIATFYNRIYRKPVGRHVILLCDSVSCWIMGFEPVRKRLLDELGLPSMPGTSADNLFTLLPATCLGACDHAPAMMVDDELFCDLTPAKIDEILARFRSGAATVASAAERGIADQR
jgi:NADH-quinone oxidoreductase subunit E